MNEMIWTTLRKIKDRMNNLMTESINKYATNEELVPGN